MAGRILGMLGLCGVLCSSCVTMQDKAKTFSYIDIHFHADARAKDGGDLPKVAAWMTRNGVEQLIVLPLARTLPQNAKEAQQELENYRTYQGTIYRFCVLFPDDVESKDAAVTALKELKSAGVIGFGEHYGKKLYFDDPKCMQLYAACAEVGLPVLFHMDGGNNKDDENLSHLENALTKHPGCVFIGHGPGFWKRIKSADRLMGKHKNLYADISAGSGAKGIGRDKDYGRAFLVRHADQVLFGTDGGPWSFGKEPPPHFALVESLNLPAEVKTKLCRQNAMALFGLK